MERQKRFFIKTYGCQANVADSGEMAGMLEASGFERYTPKTAQKEKIELEEALKNVEVFIINSCAVRQKSEDKVYGLGKLVLATQENTGRKPFVIMSGCVVGSSTGARKLTDMGLLQKKTPWVDLYLSPADIAILPRKLYEVGVITQSLSSSLSYSIAVEDPDWAFVNISTGCDNFCSYCVVPYARGAEISRSQEAILADVEKLLARGYGKIMLVGQNVNSWGLEQKDKLAIRIGQDLPTPFAKLLREVHEMAGLESLTFMSSNPFDFTSELVSALKLPKIHNYLHIAVQSGNNAILKKMNRRHTVEDFLALLENIKQAVPNMEFGTDIIVGFPSETRGQFMDTVKLFEQVLFKAAFISKYSPRKGTVAQRLYPDDVSPKEKSARHAYLTKVWQKHRNK